MAHRESAIDKHCDLIGISGFVFYSTGGQMQESAASGNACMLTLICFLSRPALPEKVGKQIQGIEPEDIPYSFPNITEDDITKYPPIRKDKKSV